MICNIEIELEAIIKLVDDCFWGYFEVFNESIIKRLHNLHHDQGQSFNLVYIDIILPNILLTFLNINVIGLWQACDSN